MSSSETTRAARSGWVDAVKGFTITLVVAFHVLEGLDNAKLANETFLYWHDMFLTVRMPLFFLVAGLFARKAIFADSQTFFDRKVLHFGYFYLLWSGISLLLRYAANPVSNNKVELTDIFFIGWQPISTIWFLYGLILAFVLTRLLRGVNPLFIVALAAMVQAATFTFPPLPHLDVINRFAFLYVYFVLGVFGSEWIRQQAADATYSRAVAATVVFFALAVPLRLNDLIFQPLTYFLLSCVAAFALISFFGRAEQGPVSRLFQFIGAFNMPIYLTHFLPAAGMRIVFVKLFGITDFTVILIAGTIGGVVFGILACMIAVRTPLAFLFERPAWARFPMEDVSAGSAKTVPTR